MLPHRGEYMSLESSGLIALGAKLGWLKLFTLGAALAGAGLMAIFRPPKTKKEMFLQGCVALGCSFLFGDTVTNLLDGWFSFIDSATSPLDKWIQFSITVHGLVGALSWGIFGGIAYIRDRLGLNPIEAAREIKDVVTK